VTLTDNGAPLGTTTVNDGDAFSVAETLPNQGANSIVATVTDSYGNVGTSAPMVYTLENTPPTLSGTSPSLSTTDETTITPLPTLSVTDPDADAMEAVTITLSNAANGALSGAGLAGGNGVYTLASASPSSITSELESIIFTPTAHQVAPGATVTTGITLAVSNDGGPAVTSSSSITVTAVNDTPTITGAGLTTTTTDEASIKPLSGVTISDPDTGVTETLTVELASGSTLTDANGTLTGTGLTKTGVGTYILSGSTAAVTAELNALTFTPTAHQVAPGLSVDTNIIIVDDQNGAYFGVYDSVIATAVNDPPTLSGTSPSLATTDEATIKPFATLSVTDPDVGAMETVTITLSNAANGALSGAGLIAEGNGVYMLAAASPGSITSELDALIFTPTAHQVVPGASVSTGFTLSVANDGGPPVTATTSITATAVNDTPTITGAVAGQTIAAGTAIKPFAGVAITDPDVSVTDSLTITMKNTGGVATDADGTLSGGGLTKTGTGTYSLAAATPASLSAEVQALAFTPASSTSTQTTVFTLTASQTAGGSTVSTTNGTTAVTATGISYLYGPIYGNGTIEGTTGTDVITAYQYDNNIYDNGGNDTVYAGQGNANVYTSTGNVTVYLNGYYDTVSGGNGNTAISGAQGNSTISLGNGNDTVSVGGYFDTVTLGNGNDSLTGPLGNATVTIGGGSDVVNLGGYDNIVDIGSGSGTDVINAGLGNEVIFGGNGSLTITAGGYSDNVTLGNGNDIVTGMQGNANVTTGAGNDTIVLSGYGNNVNAGGGMNFITGGAGNDTFFLPTANTGLDTITNFSLTNGDILNLTQALTASGLNVQASTLGNYLKVTEVGSNAMIGIAVGGSVSNVAELVGVSSLTLAKLLPHIIY
jgi:hypothetical protein